MSEPDVLARSLADALGLPADAVTTSDADGTPCVDVPVDRWADAARHARDAWGLVFFDWLSGVDQTDVADDPGVDVVVHLAHPPSPDEGLSRVLLRTRAALPDLRVPSLTGVFAGAAWHERETHEMFGVDPVGFDDGSGLGLRPLLLPDGFEGTPLRKQFQLAARAAKPWPGAKEPGESHADGASPSRRKLLPPGVPDAATWGPRRPDGPDDGPAADTSPTGGDDGA
ncbi:NADH-quinone oxidoreductase subunit C [Thalassiella azotivora]